MKHCMLLLVLMIVATGLIADGDLLWQEDGKPLVYSKDIRWNQSVVTTLDNGKFIAWSETNSTNHDILAMRLDSEGQPIWDVPRVLVDEEYAVYDERIALSSDGNIIVSWYSYPIEQIHVMKFNLEGNPMWNETFSNDCAVGYIGEYSNCNLIPDSDGGVFAFWQQSSPNFAMHLNSAGTPSWTNPLELFEDHPYAYERLRIYTDDGEGGCIVGTVIHNPNYDYITALERIQVDGTPAWILELPEGKDQQLIRTKDGNFALLSTEYSENYPAYLYRFDLDGEMLMDEPLLLTEADRSYYSSIQEDADGNLYIGLNVRRDGARTLHTVKVTPENQISWEFEPEAETLPIPWKVDIDVDSSGNVYQAYFNNNPDGVSVLKLNPNGELSWNTIITDDSYNYSMYVDMVLDVDENGANVMWNGLSGDYDTLFRQTCNEDGSVVYGEDDTHLRQGFSNSFNSITYMVRDEPQDDMLFSWMNGMNSHLYLQSLDIDGELGIDYPGASIVGAGNCNNRVVAIREVDDQYYVIWRNFIDYSYYELWVNLFDQQGNRQWAEDLYIEGMDIASTISISMYDNQLLIYGYVMGDSWTYDLKAQRIVDGQLAWEEPVTIADGINSTTLYTVEDYVFYWGSVQRLDENGDPCEGWENGGVSLGDIGALIMEPKITDDGIVIVGQLTSNENYNRMKLQILHEDGTTEYDDPVTLIESCDFRYHTGYVVNDVVYLIGEYDDNIIFKAVDFEGNDVWDSDVILSSNVWEISDTELVSDGILVAYPRYDTETNRYNLELQHIDFAGETWDEPELVRSFWGYIGDGRITVASDNHYFITWLDTRDISETRALFGQLYHYEPLANEDPADIPAWKPNLSIYPNPFNPETTMQFSLAAKSKVDLKIYNVKGQLVRTLCDEMLPLGNHEITWDGTDSAKKNVASGVYLINLKINGTDYRSKALLLK